MILLYDFDANLRKFVFNCLY
ncbi:hypothetical protein ACVUUU_001678 [Campylobacter coli]